MIKQIRIYKNGDVGVILTKMCIECGSREWEIVEILNNKAIIKCKKCDSQIRVNVKLDDMRAEQVAREIVNDIKGEITQTFTY